MALPNAAVELLLPTPTPPVVIGFLSVYESSCLPSTETV
jgi:hypothetical protein